MRLSIKTEKLQPNRTFGAEKYNWNEKCPRKIQRKIEAKCEQKGDRIRKTKDTTIEIMQSEE